MKRETRENIELAGSYAWKARLNLIEVLGSGEGGIERMPLWLERRLRGFPMPFSGILWQLHNWGDLPLRAREDALIMSIRFRDSAKHLWECTESAKEFGGFAIELGRRKQ